MSFLLTPEQILLQRKTVTRRLGWAHMQEGDAVCAVRKCMGLKKGESVERLAVLRITSVRQEPLRRMLEDSDYGSQECIAEGFGPGSHCDAPSTFVEFFCAKHKGATPETNVTRIAFEYVDRMPFMQFVSEVHQRRSIWVPLGQTCPVESSLRAIGQLWAAGWSVEKVIRKLWPETFQMMLPGLSVSDHRHIQFGPNLVQRAAELPMHPAQVTPHHPRHQAQP